MTVEEMLEEAMADIMPTTESKWPRTMEGMLTLAKYAWMKGYLLGMEHVRSQIEATLARKDAE
jgi:hypothetical protein